MRDGAPPLTGCKPHAEAVAYLDGLAVPRLYYILSRSVRLLALRMSDRRRTEDTTLGNRLIAILLGCQDFKFIHPSRLQVLFWYHEARFIPRDVSVE